MATSVSAKVYSIEEIARRWGVDTETVRGCIKSGTLAHFRVGRLIRVTQANLDEYETGAKEQEP